MDDHRARRHPIPAQAVGPGGWSDERVLSGYFREDDAVEYWLDEE